MAKLKAFTMPKWGIEMAEGTIAEWMVAEGAPFTRGTVLTLIETDKITNEVEAEADGRDEAVHRGHQLGCSARDETAPINLAQMLQPRHRTDAPSRSRAPQSSPRGLVSGSSAALGRPGS